MKSMWQAIGVDVTIDALEDATYVKRVYLDGDFDVAFNNYTTYSDPALGIARTFVTAAIGHPFGNAARYSNPEIDRLFEQGERPASFEERGPFYRKAQAILAADLPVLTLRQHREMNVAARNFEGIAGKVQGLGLWTDAWIAK
jgi:peptide/nickel transport system substrate-binding protein